MTMTTRRQRRADRQRRYVTGRDAREAARMAGLDYKVTNESGALRVYTHSLTWHLEAGASQIPGQAGSRSGPAWVVKARGVDTQPNPMTHRRWRRLIATKAPENTQT